ncbi:hypothetical protein [Amycolatopsis sp. La24]|uniref:hypothetical protein n=1 Tax=Amycolatopsis sp. La24 TaxID=3028304 RepID=UPI0023AEE80E|nr:hypothetical protein [Amycolatopsis sp. La24]
MSIVPVRAMAAEGEEVVVGGHLGKPRHVDEEFAQRGFPLRGVPGRSCRRFGRGQCDRGLLHRIVLSRAQFSLGSDGIVQVRFLPLTAWDGN